MLHEKQKLSCSRIRHVFILAGGRYSLNTLKVQFTLGITGGQNGLGITNWDLQKKAANNIRHCIKRMRFIELKSFLKQNQLASTLL